MSEALKKRIKELLRERSRLRKHNRELISIYDHYHAMVHGHKRNNYNGLLKLKREVPA